MADTFVAKGTIAVAGDTGLAVYGATTYNPAIHYVSIGAAGTPADARIDCSVIGFDGTGAGTGTAVTPLNLNPSGRAAITTAKQTFTIEPTNALAIPYLKPNIHSRQHYQWYAREGSELYPGLVANAAIGARVDAFSSGTPSMDMVMHFTE